MKARVILSIAFLQNYLPIIAPILDRVAHAFGFCLGH